MLRLCLQTQVTVGHIHRQMQVSGHCFISQFGIQYQTGNIDLIVDAIRQIHGHFALHCGRMRIQTFSLSMYLACQFHVGAIFEERIQVHLLHIHQHVIHLVINVIESFQVCLVALIVGIACQVHPHRLQIQRRGHQIRFRPKGVGADMQSVRVNQIGVQIHQCVSIDGIKRQLQCPVRKRGISDIQATRIVEIASNIR